MNKLLNTIFNFSENKKIDFEKGIYWGIIVFLFFMYIIS
jgi:hypothetical protein